MEKIRSSFSKMRVANFSVRRVITLILAISCLVVCLFSTMGWVNLSLPVTIGILFLSLLLFEWAG